MERSRYDAVGVGRGGSGWSPRWRGGPARGRGEVLGGQGGGGGHYASPDLARRGPSAAQQVRGGPGSRCAPGLLDSESVRLA